MDLTKRTSYHYDLPKNLIAQHPMHQRDECRMLHLEKNSGQINHRMFKEIVSLLQPTDVLVVNTSKVIPARLLGNKKTGAKIEVLLLRQASQETNVSGNTAAVWQCLVKPAGRLNLNDMVLFKNKHGSLVLQGRIVSCGEEGMREIEFSEHDNAPLSDESFLKIIDEIGKVPLPPYIKRDYDSSSERGESGEDRQYYQTVYADVPGSAAAPTAGMHFTEEILREIEAKGVTIAPVVLHIGIDTFRPIKADNILMHKMHREFCTVPEKTAGLINAAKKDNHRIIAVGTTVTRTLESFASGNDTPLSAGSKWSELFIYPGYNFKIIDGLLTNFHLPESSLLMLVSAFAGYDRAMNAYRQATTLHYRFFSYGDAMLIT